ncbi:MAG: ribonucleotide reductase N-terminal alpha domain-containing protein [Candidatus Hodarchaeales archaeon]|jgi:hypothetical protein
MGTTTEKMEKRLLTENALKVMEKRYLARDEEGRIIESPEEMFRRVARNVAEVELRYGKAEAEVARVEKAFYDVMRQLKFLPNSPCFVTGSPVLMEYGYSNNIESIKTGDKVISDDGSVNEVTKVFEREVKEEILTINVKKLMNETLKLTKNHPVLAMKNSDLHYNNSSSDRTFGKRKPKQGITARPRWTYAGYLEVGDYVVVNPYSNLIEDIDYITVSDFVDKKFEIRGNRIILVHERETPTGGKGLWKKGNWIPNRIEVDGKFLRLCGYWLAEGTLSISLMMSSPSSRIFLD